jgi:hypothetical protein
MGEMTAAWSLLYLEQRKERGVNALESWSGPEGIEHYLAADLRYTGISPRCRAEKLLIWGILGGFIKLL